MFSSKNNPLKAITLTIASAMAAALLAGCSESVSEQNSTDIGNQSIAEVTSSVTSAADSEPISVEIPVTAEVISTVDSENPEPDVISDTESVEILPIETAESMSDSQDTDEDVTENSDEAAQIAQDRNMILATEEAEAVKVEKDKLRADRYKLANDTDAYTT